MDQADIAQQLADTQEAQMHNGITALTQDERRTMVIATLTLFHDSVEALLACHVLDETEANNIMSIFARVSERERSTVVPVPLPRFGEISLLPQDTLPSMFMAQEIDPAPDETEL